MLIRLLKLDIKFGYKKFLTMAGIMVVLGLLLPFLINLTGFLGLSGVLMLTLLITAISCIWLIIQHFYRNLFSNEGYLMFTLPVKPWQLLLSKTLTTLMWYNLFIIAAAVMALFLNRDHSGIIESIKLAFSTEFFPIMVEMWVALNTIAIAMIMALYAGLTLSSVAVRGRSIGVIGGVVATIALLFGYFTLQNKVTNMVQDHYFKDFDPTASLTFMQQYGHLVAMAALTAVFGILLFMATQYMMSKKLNLK